MARCSYHRNREAVGACVNCSTMVCLECQTLLGGKVYCQPCAYELFVQKAPEAAKPAAAAESVSGAWWLLPLFLTWVGGIIAWACTKERNPQKARSMLLWGIGLTLLYWAFYFIMMLIWAFVAGGNISLQAQ